jgi:hypothetical protein
MLLLALSTALLFLLSLLFSIIHIFVIVDWFIRLFFIFVLN